MAQVHYEYDDSFVQIDVKPENLSFDSDSSHWVIQTEDEITYIPRENVYRVEGQINSKETDNSSKSGVTLI